MEDFEDSTFDSDSSLTSSDEDTSAGGYQVIQPYSHEPLSDKKQTQSPQLDQFFGREIRIGNTDSYTVYCNQFILSNF